MSQGKEGSLSPGHGARMLLCWAPASPGREWARLCFCPRSRGGRVSPELPGTKLLSKEETPPPSDRDAEETRRCWQGGRRRKILDHLSIIALVQGSEVLDHDAFWWIKHKFHNREDACFFVDVFPLQNKQKIMNKNLGPGFWECQWVTTRNSRYFLANLPPGHHLRDVLSRAGGKNGGRGCV